MHCIALIVTAIISSIKVNYNISLFYPNLMTNLSQSPERIEYNNI